MQTQNGEAGEAVRMTTAEARHPPTTQHPPILSLCCCISEEPFYLTARPTEFIKRASNLSLLACRCGAVRCGQRVIT